jgi:DNA polymerase-1|tara:strand:+ start:1226 stop:2092 length:867 start_codon:yes stop_codon:yes gene_type:complete
VKFKEGEDKMKVLILDGYNLIYRAKHSTPKWIKDSSYGIIFNFFRSLRPLVEKFNPDRVYFVLEGAPKARLEVLPEYKGTRVREEDTNFRDQRNLMIDLLANHFPIVVARHEDYECDDVIGFLVEHAHAEDDCTVVSSDTDFIQLYNRCPNFQLYNPIRKSIVNKTEYDYVSWKALRGDSADNIPGFKGIGDKRAAGLLENQEKLEKFLSSSPDKRELFEKNIFLIRFHDLSNCSAEIKFSRAESNWDFIYESFKNFKFESIIKENSWNKFVGTFSNLSGVIDGSVKQ